MKFADIIQKVNLNIKRKFRLLEKTKIKIIKKEWSIKYNEICIYIYITLLTLSEVAMYIYHNLFNCC